MSKSKKIIIIGLIIILVISVIALVVLRDFLEKREIKEKQYTNAEQFSEIKELITYLDCKYIKEEDSTDENYTTDIYLEFKCDLYTDGKSNEDFFKRIVSLIAEKRNYDGFRLIDTSKQILISVLCDYENSQISRVYINGDSNYYGNTQSKNVLENYEQTPLTGMAIQSPELANLIQNEWITQSTSLGNKTGEEENVSIYENGQYEIKTVYKKTFNIIFYDTYKNPVLNNITTSTSMQDVINILGTPTFGSVEENIIGYKGSYIYVFFTKNQISVYRNQTDFSSDNFVTLLNIFEQDKDIKKFVSSLTDIWPDYDVYDYSENYVKLKYTLKGITIMFNVTNNNGVTVSNNYAGYLKENKTMQNIKDENIALPEWIYFDKEDLIYKEEQERVNNILAHNGGDFEDLEEVIE